MAVMASERATRVVLTGCPSRAHDLPVAPAKLLSEEPRSAERSGE
jgi:hypothetical protein